LKNGNALRKPSVIVRFAARRPLARAGRHDDGQPRARLDGCAVALLAGLLAVLGWTLAWVLALAAWRMLVAPLL
jgi:hypothetical protein